MSSGFEDCGMETPPEDLAVLVQLVGEAHRPGADRTLVVEVGSWTGRTAIAMADAGALVWCVDRWDRPPSPDPADVTDALLTRHGGGDAVLRAFCKNAGSRLFLTLVPVRGSSLFWASAWPHTVPLDVVFLDGDHREEHVRADIMAWRRRLRPAGVMVVHDYGLFPGVTRAVDELAPRVTRVGRTLAYWQEGVA